MTKSIVTLAGLVAAIAATSPAQAAAYPVRVTVVNDHWADIVVPEIGDAVPGLRSMSVEVTSEASMVRLLKEIEALNFLRNSSHGEDGLSLAYPALDEPAAGGGRDADEAAAKAAQAVADAAAAEKAAADAAAAAAAASGKKADKK